MKRLLLFGVLGVLALPLLAQPVRELTRLPTSGLIPGSQAYAFSNERGVLLLFQTQQRAEVLHLDTALTLLHRFELTDLPPRDSVQRLGFTYRDGTLNIVYRAFESDDIQVLRVLPDSARSELFRMDMSELFAGSTQWANFTYQGALHMIRLSRSGDQVRLCRFEGGRNFHAETFHLEQLRLDYTLQEQAIRIDSSNRHLLGKTYLPAKIYLQGNQLYFTLDRGSHTTVAQIDLDLSVKQEYRLSYPSSEGRSNSLLDGPNLYQLSATPDSLYLRIHDLTSHTPLRTFGYAANEPVELRSGPLRRRRPGQPQTEEEWALDALLREWANAPALALALQAPSDDLVELTLGAVWPQRGHGLTGVVIDEQVERLAFPSLFDLRTLAPANKQTPALVSKQLISPPVQPGSMVVQFSLRGQPHWGYYDTDQGEYVLMR